MTGSQSFSENVQRGSAAPPKQGRAQGRSAAMRSTLTVFPAAGSTVGPSCRPGESWPNERGALDAMTRQALQDEILSIVRGTGATAFFVTHDLEEAIALSDRVVIMSAGPAARIIGDWTVPLLRPRDTAEVRLDSGFHQLHRDIWQTLKAEVVKGYECTEGV